MLLSSIAYEIIYNTQSFRDYEKRVAILDSEGVDVGNINHSRDFVTRFLQCVYDYIKELCVNFFHTSLECTNQLPPLCFKADKFTHKKEGSQAVIVRHPSLKNGKLFRETYVDHAKVEECGSEYWAKLLIKSIKSNFGFSDEEIRQVFAGAAADGQYIQCNLDRHLSSELNLPFEFTTSVTIWDYCHMIERADVHAREKNPWVIIFDDRMKEIMRSNNKGEYRLKLIQICEKETLIYSEFVFYSDTRFGEYRYRTYSVMISMHKPLYLMYQQLASADSTNACDYQQKILQLQNPTEIIKLLF